MQEQFLKLHDEAAPYLTLGVEKVFTACAREGLARFDNGARSAVEILPDPIWKGFFASHMTRPLKTACEEGMRWEVRSLGLASIRQAVPNLRIAIPPHMQQAIYNWLDQRRDGIWRAITDTTRRRLTEEITKAVAEGKGIASIRDTIHAILDDKPRAAIIAQTEATGSLNAGAQLLRTNEGITHKIWLSTSDGLTRESHAQANQQMVENAGHFLVGSSRMKFPGDTSMGAGAADVVNCRCCASGRRKR